MQILRFAQDDGREDRMTELPYVNAAAGPQFADALRELSAMLRAGWRAAMRDKGGK
jgi:hypothetical protein